MPVYQTLLSEGPMWWNTKSTHFLLTENKSKIRVDTGCFTQSVKCWKTMKNQKYGTVIIISDQVAFNLKKVIGNREGYILFIKG